MPTPKRDMTGLDPEVIEVDEEDVELDKDILAKKKELEELNKSLETAKKKPLTVDQIKWQQKKSKKVALKMEDELDAVAEEVPEEEDDEDETDDINESSDAEEESDDDTEEEEEEEVIDSKLEKEIESAKLLTILQGSFDPETKMYTFVVQCNESLGAIGSSLTLL